MAIVMAVTASSIISLIMCRSMQPVSMPKAIRTDVMLSEVARAAHSHLRSLMIIHISRVAGTKGNNVGTLGSVSRHKVVAVARAKSKPANEVRKFLLAVPTGKVMATNPDEMSATGITLGLESQTVKNAITKPTRMPSWAEREQEKVLWLPWIESFTAPFFRIYHWSSNLSGQRDILSLLI
jgi:hypothetical protein